MTRLPVLKKYLCYVALHFAIVFPSGSVFSNELSTAYKDAAHLAEIWLDAQKDYGKIPMISGSVTQNQHVIWHGAFGVKDIESQRAVEGDTMNSICSISKVFTATAIMNLVDEGQLKLNDKVKDILPNYGVNQAFPENGEVTVESLLTHTSGVPRDTSHAYWSGPDFPFPDKEAFFADIKGKETTHAVGTVINYSNVGYALLGAIIEEVSGLSYKHFMEQRIFQPLKMANSVVEMQPSLYGTQHAIGYTAINRDGNRKQASFYQTRAMQPAAGISTTSADLAKFAQWKFSVLSGSDKRLVTFDSLSSMFKNHTTGIQSRSKRGYGYEVSERDGKTWAMHGGMCPGYNSFLKINVTDKMAYNILVNANKVRARAYVDGLIKIFERAKQIPTQQAKEIDLSGYIGFYNVNPWNSEYYVAKWGTDLILLYLPADSLTYALYQYRHKEGDTFQLLDGDKVTDEVITFMRDEHGKVVKVKNDGGYHAKMHTENNNTP